MRKTIPPVGLGQLHEVETQLLIPGVNPDQSKGSCALHASSISSEFPLEDLHSKRRIRWEHATDQMRSAGFGHRNLDEHALRPSHSVYEDVLGGYTCTHTVPHTETNIQSIGQGDEQFGDVLPANQAFRALGKDIPAYSEYDNYADYGSSQSTVEPIPIVLSGKITGSALLAVVDTAFYAVLNTNAFVHPGGAPLSVEVSNYIRTPGIQRGWWNFDKDTGVLSGNVSLAVAAASKTQDLNITAFSACGTSLSATLTITFNSPPAAAGLISRQVAREGKPFRLTLPLASLFSDNEGDSIAVIDVRDVTGVSADLEAKVEGGSFWSSLDDFPELPKDGEEDEFYQYYSAGFDQFAKKEPMSPLEADPALIVPPTANDKTSTLGTRVSWLTVALSGDFVTIQGTLLAGQAPALKRLRIVATDAALLGPSFAHLDFEMAFVRDCETSSTQLWSKCSSVCGSKPGTQTQSLQISRSPLGLTLGAENCPPPTAERACNNVACDTLARVEATLALSGVDPTQITTSFATGLRESIASSSGVRPEAVAIIRFTDSDSRTIFVRDDSPGARQLASKEHSEEQAAVEAGGDSRRRRSLQLAGIVEAEVHIYVAPSEGSNLNTVSIALQGAVSSGSLSARVVSSTGTQVQMVLEAISARGTSGTNQRPKTSLATHILQFHETESIITLASTDLDGHAVQTAVVGFQGHGKLHFLSENFINYGYEPKAGLALPTVSPVKPAVLPHEEKRILFQSGSAIEEYESPFSVIVYTATDSDAASVPGEVWIVREDLILVSEFFTAGSAGWSIVNNGRKAAAQPAGGVEHQPFGFDHVHTYIVGSDEDVFVPVGSGADAYQWHFAAPPSFVGRYPAAYGGNLSFVLAALEGSFTYAESNANASMVKLRCKMCRLGEAMEIVYFPQGAEFDPVKLETQQLLVSLPLLPALWKRSATSSLEDPHPVSECDMMSMLAELDELLILGDYMLRRESIALDAVSITAGPGTLPQQCLF